MSTLTAAAVAPVLICIFYIYIRDKYEKEPVKLLAAGVFCGILITAPIVKAEELMTGLLPVTGKYMEAFFLSFAVAALVEETFKFVCLFFLTWKNDNLNERFDGIVYAVFISLGFAGIENIMYVMSPALGGMETAAARAVFSVPGHGLFGVMMGYYFAMAKLERHKRRKMLALAYTVPFLMHGFYNFILMSGLRYMMALFVLFVALMWITGFKKMKEHLLSSPFRAK